MIQIGGCVGLFCCLMNSNIIEIDSSIGMFGYNDVISREASIV